MLLIGVQHLLCGREDRCMYVLGSCYLVKEVRKILSLCEACKLRNIVQANIDDPGNAC